jgi:hypothetical protein
MQGSDSSIIGGLAGGEARHIHAIVDGGVNLQGAGEQVGMGARIGMGMCVWGGGGRWGWGWVWL